MWKRSFAAFALGAFAATFAFAQDRPTAQPKGSEQPSKAEQPSADATTAPEKGSAGLNLAFRASDLEGLDVRNKAGEKIGSVHDLVIDVENGKVRYVAVSYGGFAGVGDKLFAIPLHQFKAMKDTEDDVYFFSTNLTEEKMKNAPGFDEENWPAMASQTQWTKQVDEYYGDDDRIDAEKDATPDRLVPRDR